MLCHISLSVLRLHWTNPSGKNNSSETDIMSTLMSNPFMHLSRELIRHQGRRAVLSPAPIPGRLPPPLGSYGACNQGAGSPGLKTLPRVNFFQSVPGLRAALLPLPSASQGFCFSGMAASILEVGNVIVSRLFLFLFFFIIIIIQTKHFFINTSEAA